MVYLNSISFELLFRAASEWLFVVPWGLRKLLNWIKVTYDNPVVYITENGFSDGGQLDDTERIDYHKKYIAEAQKGKVSRILQLTHFRLGKD